MWMQENRVQVSMSTAIKVGMGAILPTLRPCRIFVNEYTCGDILVVISVVAKVLDALYVLC